MRFFYVIVALFFLFGSMGLALNQHEQECFDKIFRPAQRSHTILKERITSAALAHASSNDNDISSDTSSQPFDVEEGLWEMPPFDIKPDIVKTLAQQLTQEEIDAIGTIMQRFVDYLRLENQFHDAYFEQLKNIRYTMLVGGGSLIVFLLALVPLGLAEIAQMQCDDYECVFDDDTMIITDNGDGPTHYCGHNGQDFDCLQFFAIALGNVDLTHATYEPHCSKDLNEELINATIPLAQIKHFHDTTCQIIVGLVPVLDAACLLLPTTVLGYTIKKGFDLKKLRRQIESIKQEPEDFESWYFETGIEKIEQISAPLKAYIDLAGSTFGIGPQTGSLIERLFKNSPFHTLVEEMLTKAGFGNTIKAAWKSF